MFRDGDGGILRDIAGSLGGTNLDDEAAEATEIDVFAMSQRIFNDFHELFDSVEHVGAVDTGRL